MELEYLREYVLELIKDQIKAFSELKCEIAKETNKMTLYSIIDSNINNLKQLTEKEIFYKPKKENLNIADIIQEEDRYAIEIKEIWDNDYKPYSLIRYDYITALNLMLEVAKHDVGKANWRVRKVANYNKYLKEIWDNAKNNI